MTQKAKNTIKHGRKRRIIGLIFRLLVWISAALLYYACFALLFDTPEEYHMREQTNRLRAEYEQLNSRYDSLEMILNNITVRDQSVFRILFETDPYDLDIEQQEQRLANYEKNISKSKKQLLSELPSKTEELSKRCDELEKSWHRINELSEKMGTKVNSIPSIQPVINKQLTLLTAGYGTIINPFYRTLKSHQGVDYTVGEGSSIFATADGTIKEISDKNSTLGKTIIIDHGNGYQTSYSHLLSVGVRRGQKVQRGDIIALSGNSGLSLAPHLHYEVSYNGMRIDPIHYFFMELSPEEYQRIIRIAQSGMQSFD